MEYSVPANIMEEMEANSPERAQGTMEDKVIQTVANSVTTDLEEDLPDPIDYLKQVMDKRGLRNKDMKVYIGSSGNVCSVLKRHKPLTIRMIRNLHKYLHIPAKILIQPYSCH